MKLFSKEQIYQGDAYTVKKQGITSTELMERAGVQIFNWLHLRMQGAQVPIHVFCGIGNNGGDGLVVARHLITHGYNVQVYIVNYSEKRSVDFLVNYDRIKTVTKQWPAILKCVEDFPKIEEPDIIIDAVFGIGLNRAITPWVKALFTYFKSTKAFVVSVDIPSGLQTDKAPVDKDSVVYAGFTLSFQSAKLVFFLPETAKYTVQWEVLDIGIDPEFLYTTQTEAHLIGKHEVLGMYKPRTKFSHKGNYGHAFIIGGSYGKIGAVILASRGCLSAGAGLVTAYAPKCGYQILQTSFPEAMVVTDAHSNHITNITFLESPQVVALGVGLGTHPETIKAVSAFLKQTNLPLVIDADGLNILAKHKELLKDLPAQTVLTPHVKELERLIGIWTDDFDKLNKVKAFSNTYNVVVTIKGAHTITVYQDTLYVNTTGNPGMATAGMGDVLTGVITGLIAQGYTPLEASVFGVYLHGKSGDIAIQDLGYQSVISTHVINYLGDAYIDLFKQPEPPEVDEEVSEA